MMNQQADFYARKLKEWEEKMKAAAEAGDYEAWQFSSHEVENYKQMLERVNDSS